LSIDHDVENTELPPAKFVPIWANPVARLRRATQLGFPGGDVIDGNDPGKPAAPLLGRLLHGPTEGRFVNSRVIEGGDNLDIAMSSKGQDEIPSAE
jgi:hypothetical protein